MALTGLQKHRLRSALGDKGTADAIGDAIALIDGVTPGTNQASKAIVAGTDGKVGATTFDGAVTQEAVGLTTAGVGAKNGATVTVAEYGDGVIHKTVLTCTATPLTFGDEGGQGQYGGVKVYDFPAGLILTLGAVVAGNITLTAPAINNWDGDVGLGVEAPTDHQDVANKTGIIMPKCDVSAGDSDKIGVVDGVSVATALTESGARWLDGTATAKDLYLNFLVDDNVAHDNTITGTFTGTITIVWMNIGDN